MLHSSIEQRHCKFPGKPGSHSLPSSFDPFPDSAKQSSLPFFRSVLDPQNGWRPVNFSHSKLLIWAHYGSVHFQKIQLQPFRSPYAPPQHPRDLLLLQPQIILYTWHSASVSYEAKLLFHPVVGENS